MQANIKDAKEWNEFELLKGHMKNGIFQELNQQVEPMKSLITRLAFILSARVEILSRPVM